MKKLLTIMMAMLVISLFYLFQCFRMEFADAADYTQQDKGKYYFYTPELLKSMPRISNIYSFHYSNVSGPNPALIHQISFFGTADAREIDTYLERKGYKIRSICNTNGSCWVGENPKVTLSVSIEENPNIIKIEMIDKID